MVNEKRLFSVCVGGGILGSIILPDVEEVINASDNVIIKVCGFDNVDEYQKCYPGEFKVGSGAWNELIGNEMVKTPNGLIKLKDADKEIQDMVGVCDSDMIYHELIDTKDPHKIPAAVGWNSNQYGSMFAIAPTIKEAKKCLDGKMLSTMIFGGAKITRSITEIG